MQEDNAYFKRGFETAVLGDSLITRFQRITRNGSVIRNQSEAAWRWISSWRCAANVALSGW